MASSSSPVAVAVDWGRALVLGAHPLAVLRRIWLVGAVGLVTAAAWMVITVRVISFAELERARTTTSMAGQNDSSAHPSTSLGVTVLLLAVLVATSGFRLERRMIRRSSAFRRIPEGGDDYRTSTSRLASQVRAQVAMVRAFGLRMGLIMAFAIGLAAWATMRSKPPFGAPMIGVGVTGRYLSRAVEGCGIAFVALALLVSVWPTRRRLEAHHLPPAS